MAIGFRARPRPPPVMPVLRRLVVAAHPLLPVAAAPPGLLSAFAPLRFFPSRLFGFFPPPRFFGLFPAFRLFGFLLPLRFGREPPGFVFFPDALLLRCAPLRLLLFFPSAFLVSSAFLLFFALLLLACSSSLRCSSASLCASFSCWRRCSSAARASARMPRLLFLPFPVAPFLVLTRLLFRFLTRAFSRPALVRRQRAVPPPRDEVPRDVRSSAAIFR